MSPTSWNSTRDSNSSMVSVVQLRSTPDVRSNRRGPQYIRSSPNARHYVLGRQPKFEPARRSFTSSAFRPLDPSFTSHARGQRLLRCGPARIAEPRRSRKLGRLDASGRDRYAARALHPDVRAQSLGAASAGLPGAQSRSSIGTGTHERSSRPRKRRRRHRNHARTDARLVVRRKADNALPMAHLRVAGLFTKTRHAANRRRFTAAQLSRLYDA